MSNRCAVYVRVSTDDQRDNGYSIDSQLRIIKEYCEKNDYLIVDVYNDAGHLEVEPIEAQVVKEIFELCKKGHSTRNIATIMKDNNAYLKTGKWRSDRVYKILTNSIYIGIFEYGKYKRKPQDILRVNNYCEPIIDEQTWNITRTNLEKNKHPNYGEHIHLFTSIIKWPDCGGKLSSTNSFKNSGTEKEKVYYHLTCKNSNCKSKGLHYSSDKIEQKLGRILNELTRYMYDTDNEIIICNSTKTKEIKDIDNAIEKLKQQEKKLVDLYLSSTLNVEAINHKNEVIKKEINKLTQKKNKLDPNDDFKDYTVELLKKLDCNYENDNNILFKNKLGFTFLWDSLNRKTKKELIQRLIASLEITRDKNYNIEIKNIKFTDEFISKSNKEYLNYLNKILNNNEIGIKYSKQINKQKLEKLEQDYFIFSTKKYEDNEYSEGDLTLYMELIKQHFYQDGIINCPYIEDENIVDNLLLIPKTIINI